MKKRNTFTLFTMAALVMITQLAWGANAPVLGPIPNQTAMIGELFTLDVDALFADPPESYELLESRPGMTINPTTGVITWTATAVQDGGIVLVRAYNSAGSSQQQFTIFVADALACDGTVNSYWKLDETSGSTFVDNVGFHHATAFSAVTDTIGMVGNAQVLAPASTLSEGFRVPHSTDLTWKRESDFSISFWFRWSGGGDVSQALLGKGGVVTTPFKSLVLFTLYTDDPDTGYPRVGFLLKNDGNNTDFFEVRHHLNIQPNIWYHVTGVYNGIGLPSNPTMALYINAGTPVSNGNVPFLAGDFESDNPLWIGSWDAYGHTKFPFSGALDEVVIMNKALSGTEVNNMYSEGIAGVAQCPKPGNYAPAFTSAPVTEATEGVAYNYAATVSDYEGEGLQRAAEVLPSWMNFSTTNGLLSGTPSGTDVGDTTVILSVFDGTSTVYQQFTVSVENVPEAPEITSNPSSTSIDEDVEFTYTVVAVDNDPGDVVTLTGLEIPDWMNFNTTTGVLSGTPTNDQVQYSDDSTFNVIIEARDQSDLTDTQEFTLTVNNVNDAPVVQSQNTVSTDRNVPLTLTYDMLNVTDVDDHYPADHSLTIKAGTNYTASGMVLTPADNFHGDLNVNIEISDGDDAVDYVLEVTVNFVNVVPSFTSTPNNIGKEGAIYTYAILAQDPDTDQTLTWSAEVIPAWLNFDVNTHVLAGVPNRAAVGSNPVKIGVNDGFETVYHEFVIEVEITNNAPIIISTPLTFVNNYSEYTYTFTATDPDAGDVLTYTAVNIPGWLSFDGSTGILSGIPEKSHVGTHIIKLRVSDGYTEVDQDFTITVNNVNAAPIVLSTPPATVKVDGLYMYLVNAMDPEGNAMTFTGTSIPEWLSFDASSKILNGKPGQQHIGDHTVIITISDGQLATVHQFTITVESKWPDAIDQPEMLSNNIYPNPASDYVIFELNQSGSVNIEISDLSGKRVALQKVDGAGKHSVDVSHLKSGLYMYRVYNEDKMDTGKLIIE